MYFIYIIYSHRRDRYYVGYTSDIISRIAKHNSAATISTKSGIPWELVYSEQYVTKTEALKREKAIKKMKSRKYIEYLIKKG
ncbi:MAG: GIY-YIG nuclease family protein [Bacteroidales bacterium]|jgi:putative endonuclease|nr:GIY-YIG nuclease family protein [Bacteroidales bacterium]